MDEQPVRRRLAAPPAHAEPACDHGEVHGRTFGSGVAAGVASQLSPQLLEPLAVTQQADIEPKFVSRGSQAVQVAAGPVDLVEDMQAETGVNRLGQDGKTRQPEPPPPEPCLAQPSPRLERDHEHVLAVGADRLQHRSGQHRRGVDAGERNPMPHHRVDPRIEHLGAGDGAEQDPIVAPSVRLPLEPRRVDVARVAERPVRPGAHQGAALPHRHVRDRLLAELFLHDVGDDAGHVVRVPLDVACELRVSIVMRREGKRCGQLSPVPAVHRQPGAGDDEYPLPGHQATDPATPSSDRHAVAPVCSPTVSIRCRPTR